MVKTITNMWVEIGLKGSKSPIYSQFGKVERALVLAISIDNLSTVDMIISPTKEYLDIINEFKQLLIDLGIKK